MRTLLGVALAAYCGATVQAQGPLMQPGFVAGGPAAVADVVPAAHQAAPTQSPFVNAHGEPFVMPVQYCDPMMGGGGYGGPAGGPGGGAFMNTEQYGPHYFDFSAEYLQYYRDDQSFGDVPISTAGFANEDLAGLAGQTLLSTGQLGNTDVLHGYRLTGRIDVGALSVFEVTYSGLFDSSNGAFVEVPDTEATARLFSSFSRFGTRTNGGVGSTPGRPIDSLTPPGNGNPANDNPGGQNFAETDFASRHEISYESELHTAEALFRRYWVGHNPRVSGTILIGFRYTSLSEQLGFTSIGSIQTGTSPDTFGPDPTQTATITADADNHLAGFEVGGDVWVGIIPGLRVGSEVKVGVYNNDYEVSTNTVTADGVIGLGPDATLGTADDIPDSAYDSVVSDNQVAFLTEVRLTAVADLTPSLSIKGGYELLYISDVALAGNGIATATPYGDINGISDTSTFGGFDTNGDVFYHGFHAGLEYVW